MFRLAITELNASNTCIPGVGDSIVASDVRPRQKIYIGSYLKISSIMQLRKDSQRVWRCNEVTHWISPSPAKLLKDYVQFQYDMRRPRDIISLVYPKEIFL